VRHRAEEIAQLVSDPSRLREEREKAKANKAKYKGVSAAEMRMGGGSSGFGSGSAGSGRRGFDPSSLQRPGEPKRTTSGFGSSGIGTASSGRDFGADSFNGGGRSSVPDRYSVSGTASAGSFESSPRGHHPGAGASSGDAVAATRARIEQLKLQERASGGATGKAGVEGDAAGGKKRLTDVKVNPKIAASLGLKVAPPAQKGASGPPPPVGVPGEVDLLGGLEDPEPAPAVAAAPGTDTNGGWDAFGGDAPAAAPAPFEAFGTSPSQSASKGASPVAKAPLPEDIFADLTGLSKPMQPMAAVSSGNRPAGASLLSSGSPLATAAAGPASGSGGVADFADFSSVPAAPATQHAPAKDPFADLLA